MPFLDNSTTVLEARYIGYTQESSSALFHAPCLIVTIEAGQSKSNFSNYADAFKIVIYKNRKHFHGSQSAMLVVDYQ